MRSLSLFIFGKALPRKLGDNGALLDHTRGERSAYSLAVKYLGDGLSTLVLALPTFTLHILKANDHDQAAE